MTNVVKQGPQEPGRIFTLKAELKKAESKSVNSSQRENLLPSSV
jgi:hypothetical protein